MSAFSEDIAGPERLRQLTGPRETSQSLGAWLPVSRRLP